MRLSPEQAQALSDAWKEQEGANPFANTYASICRAMEEVNDPEQYVRGVEALVSGLPRQLHDLHEMIRLTGKTVDEFPGSEALTEDPLEFLARRLEGD